MKHPVFFAALLLAGTAGRAQEPDTRPRSIPPEVQARADSMRALRYPPATTEGISAEELLEYTAIVDNHKSRPDEPFYEYSRRITPAEKERLRALFGRMNRQQQLAQHIVFRRVDPPRPEKRLTEAELATFRDSTQYRIVVDFRPAGGPPPPPYTAADIWWYEVSPSMIRHAGSAYFTRDVRLQTLAGHERDQQRYDQYKDSYEMVLITTSFRSERVQRPAN